MQSNSVIYFRRLATSQDTVTRNKFMKMELTKSPDNREDAFRFYIRNADTQEDFTEDFSQENVQASGLFIPSDVGIDLFDGEFHHLVVSWDMNELNFEFPGPHSDWGRGSRWCCNGLYRWV